MTALPLGVESDSLLDIEVGAVVFSKSIQQGNGMAGGVVVGTEVLPDGELEIAVLRNMQGTPYIHLFEGSDINMEHTRWFAREARDAAETIHRWLSDRRNRRSIDDKDRARWSLHAALLAEAGSTGLYLPRAGQRYRDRFEAKRAAS